MRKIVKWIIVAAALTGLFFGGYFLWEQLTRAPAEELAVIVQRDGIPFEMEAFPAEMVDRLAENQVVLLGEYHFLREHRQLVAAMVTQLHARGFRQYLFEWTQAVDWLLADYVNDGGLAPDWTPPHDIGGQALTAIRDFNRTVPAAERIQVHGIDIHLDDYGGTAGWQGIMGLVAGYLPEPGPLAPFLEGDHSTFQGHTAQLEELQPALTAQRQALQEAWGQAWYQTVVEMVEVELWAVPMRAARQDDYDRSAALREAAIQRLADRRVAEADGGTVINFGTTHAQKEGAWGTDGVEWLGDYLAHRSPVTAGRVIAVQVAPAAIAAVPGSGYADTDLGGSPDNELLRVINTRMPGQMVFLPLDDPLFLAGRVAYSHDGEVNASQLKRLMDAVILLPAAQRDYTGD